MCTLLGALQTPPAASRQGPTPSAMRRAIQRQMAMPTMGTVGWVSPVAAVVRGGRTRPTHTHKFVGVAILTASRGGVQLSPHRQPRARATSHCTALSLGQRQVRLGREKPVDHRSRAHAQPPTPPSLRTWEPVLSPAGAPRREGSAQQLSWALNGRWVGTQLGSCCRRGCVRTANVCVAGVLSPAT